MRKLLTLITGLFVSLVFASQVFAAIPNLSARIEQPKSPTNINELDITVVTLDRQGRAITVKCFKKAPSDAGYVQFGSDIAVTPGGNSVHCETNSTILPTNGTYLFFAEAYAQSDVATTTTVSVDYNTSGPGTPTNYSKSRTDCTYTIHFRSADDAGKTVKVNIYRSDSTAFNLDSGTLVGTVNIGSNTDADFANTVPDCSKTYYYAIRAFDSADNGSGVVGDSEVHTTTTTTTTTGTSAGVTQGAVAAGTAGNILGEATGATGAEGTAAGEVMGEGSPATSETYTPPKPGRVVWPWAVGAGLALLLIAWLLRKKQPTG